MPNNSDQAALHDELRARLLAAADEAMDTGLETDDSRLLREAIAALTLPASEAVAWLCVAADGSAADAVATIHARDTYAQVGRKIAPLYAVPPDCVPVAAMRLLESDLRDSANTRIYSADERAAYREALESVTALIAEASTTPQPPPAAHAGGEAAERNEAAGIGGDGLPFSPYLISEWAGPDMKDRKVWTAYSAEQMRAYRAASPIPVDALRELAAKWRAGSALAAQFEAPQEMLDTYNQCADELTALLSGGAAREGK